MIIKLHMVKRSYWTRRIEAAWQERSLIWLSGVRRVGKTILCQSLEDVEYFDCELPRVRRQMEDPEGFLEGLRGKRVVLDEVHRLQDPSELLKIAADHFPGTKVLATGSSTLGASFKFRDTLAGRKRDIWLPPMVLEDMDDFEDKGWDHRFLRGGLPPFYLADEFPERDFQEWVDAYWAKDVQELFRVDRRESFVRFFELLVQQSGGMFEASRLAAPSGVSRTTLGNYLEVFRETYVFHVLRPYAKYKTREIVSAPKVYCFDTGFVAYYKGWESLREEDRGALWEHFVLNQICAHGWSGSLRYWRDKQKREVDFVLLRRGKPPLAIETKWKAGQAEHHNLLAFHASYPEADLVVVASDIDRSYQRTSKGVPIRYVSLKGLVRSLDRVPRS
jgi:predicted AAA+ superfamily ATPase